MIAQKNLSGSCDFWNLLQLYTEFINRFPSHPHPSREAAGILLCRSDSSALSGLPHSHSKVKSLLLHQR